MILIKNARAIVSCDSEDRVYYDTDLLIDGPKIIQIGKDLAQGHKIDEVIDGRNKFVYPGLVNTHHHFFQTFVRNLISIDYPNMTVPEWLDKIYRVFQIINEDVIYYSTLTALTDLIKHGCTCAFDHQYCYTSQSGKKLVDRQMDAAALLGIRYHAGRGGNTLPRSEGSTIPEGMLETTDVFIEDCERLINAYHDPAAFSMRQIVVAPCQPMNSYPETFKASAELARKHNVRLHTHLGEGEDPIMQERFGMRSLAWCEDIGFAGPDLWIAHGWDIQPAEYATLASYGIGVSHCPAPAVLGGFPILDIKAMTQQGVRVSLGCDGSATNDSSSLLDSMRMAYLMQAYHSKRRGGCISPYEMLKIATVNGAQTLGRTDLGSLEVSKAADLFMIDTDVLELAGTLHDPKNLLARVSVIGPVSMTMINGSVVYQNGQLLNCDERKLADEAERVCTQAVRNKMRL
ncbi:Hydroxydechloroatrazine ethylaminohydrolase [uncultured Eubacteriales bacterium]|uniref:Hydroxydechloroatrazine ethylaminohydrolase n=1 Tax=uncultured Eubacteriales bacterium TaxID=172733 RepID=A0A212JBK3_9FIRM|nr:Hydroxydechloroatrazine ethylaminohydrolase [uncultured Eubacteriales bacterium]